jgi:D-alanine-D-alanine ligase
LNTLVERFGMKICVLQPSYEGSSIPYGAFDPPRNLAALLPEHDVRHEFLRKATVYSQLRNLKREGFDIFVNLCEGYLDWDIPSIDVIASLEQLNLPYTGPSQRLFDPSKETMKIVAASQGVRHPKFVALGSQDDPKAVLSALNLPLFVKPAHAGDSLGIDEESLVTSPEALYAKLHSLFTNYDRVLAEEYIDGREFSVLLAANPDNPAHPLVLTPIEFRFPPAHKFKSYRLKVTEHHPERNVPCSDPDLNESLRSAAVRIFRGFTGEGFARADFRVDTKGMIFFLEINFICSIFYPSGSEGTADYILHHEPIGHAGFLRHIIREGIGRHRKKQPLYRVGTGALAESGIFARSTIEEGVVVFRGEERSQRIVTRRFVESNWSDENKDLFRRYAYPVGPNVYVLWDIEPERWSPQNHSCAPNTGFRGLDVVTLRPVVAGEELTIDYSTFCGPDMEPFACRCGAPVCRGTIVGTEPGEYLNGSSELALPKHGRTT